MRLINGVLVMLPILYVATNTWSSPEPPISCAAATIEFMYGMGAIEGLL